MIQYKNYPMRWIVLRFWGNDIKKNMNECIRVIEETIFDLKIQEDISQINDEK